ncbi:MAG: YkgJ family cysteine cluster protein, partial [Fimbriiglobus sp.]
MPMPMPVRSLPVVANWDCGGCSDCCRTYHVRVTPAEKERIDGQRWDVGAVGRDPKTGEFHMNHTPDEACVLLGPDNRCRIHTKFGAAAKPLACRVYPFVMVPAGDHWRVGLRFACPSAAANHGRPLTAHAAEVSEYAKLLEADAPAGKSVTAPTLGDGQTPSWPTTLRLSAALDAILAGQGSVEHRVRRMIWFARECRRARFDNLAGDRLGEFLDLMVEASAHEIPGEPAEVPSPSWVGRAPFRQIAAIYA